MNSLRDDSEGSGEDGEECGGEGSDEGDFNVNVCGVLLSDGQTDRHLQL